MASAVPIVGSLIGGSMQNSAANHAADAQTAASRESTRANWNALGVNAQLQDPFRMGGLTAQNEYLQMMGLAPVQGQSATEILSNYTSGGANGFDPMTMQNDGITGNYNAWVAAGRPQNYDPRTGAARTGTSTTSTGASAPLPTTGYTADQVMQRLQNTPGYQTRANEGRTQIEASAAARGGLNSGAALRSLTRYGQDYNTSEYDRYMNRLAGLFGGAQQATNQIGSAASNFGQTAGNNAINAGNARANMYQQRGANNAGMLGDIGGYGASRGWWG